MKRPYAETLRFLYDNLPMFQRVGAAALKRDLGNTIQLCAELGNPHQKFRSVHVAGTNGKGSSSHMLASILAEAGYTCGLYTSPHLREFTERIRINGAEVSKEFVIDFVDRMEPAIMRIKPSFFEITVAMAFDYFAQQAVDVAVIETGLGGRLDSTNVIDPVVSLITNIGWDHKDILGDTLPQIAAEKAGIIKYRKPVVVAERQPDVAQIFVGKAAERSSPLFFAADEFSVQDTGERWDIYRKGELYLAALDPQLKGNYQKKNLPGVLKCVDILKSDRFVISEEQLRRGLERVVVNTNFRGRWQRLREKPLMICDTGHNIDGIRAVVEQIKTIPYRHLHMVIGVVKDKDVSGMLQEMPRQASYYFCQAKIPRAMNAEILREKAQALGLQGEVIPDVNEAKRKALKNASENDLIFIGGSTFVVAEIEEL